MRETALSAVGKILAKTDTKEPSEAPENVSKAAIQKSAVTCPNCGHKFNTTK